MRENPFFMPNVDIVSLSNLSSGDKLAEEESFSDVFSKYRSGKV